MRAWNSEPVVEGRVRLDSVVGAQVAGRGILGDVNNTGVVDFSDALLVALYSWDPSIVLPSHVDLWLGDVNLDGQVDRKDAVLLVTWVYDPSDPSLPEGIGELALPPAALAPDPATVSLAADGVWHRFTVEAVEPVHVVVNPKNSNPRLKITLDGSSRSYCLPEAEEGLPVPAGQDIYLAACAAGFATVELRRSDGRIIRTHTLTVTGGPRQLTDSSGESDYYSTWSPDGRHIAFSSLHNRNWDLYVMEADGANLTADSPWFLDGNYVMSADEFRRRTDDWRSGDDSRSGADPAWSPDGRHIAFSSEHEGNWDLYVMDADGTNLRRLTRHPGFDSGAAWSPDGHHIAFHSDRDDGDRELYLMDADGTNLRRLTHHSGYDEYPSWAPHGPYIVFSSDRDANYDIYVMETDGTYLYRLTDHPSADRGAAWAPDGRHIAFHSDRDDGEWDLYVMEVDGTNPRRLTHHWGMDLFPAWSPDGGRIAFSSDRDGDNSRIYVMDFLEWTQPCCGDTQ